MRRNAIRFEALAAEHFPYVWAAYRQGAFPEAFKPDLDVKAFDAALLDMVAGFFKNPAAEMVTVIGSGDLPLAIATVEYSGRLALPHAYWFPWATARARLEAGIKFFIQLKKHNLVLVTVRQGPEVKFFRHLCKYGLLRTVGKIDRYYDDGGTAMMFQSVGNG